MDNTATKNNNIDHSNDEETPAGGTGSKNTTIDDATATATTTTTASNEYVLNFAFLSFVGFLLFQAVFAIIANSQAMLADCEAMAVDALTYLFNLWAERAKKMPLDGEREMTRHERMHRRELRRLYLELIPPSISCITLIGITIITLREAFATLQGNQDGEEDVSVVIMMIFSTANLLLDVVNVTCFARASSLFGLDVVRQENRAIYDAIANEHTPLVAGDQTPPDTPAPGSGGGILSRIPIHKFHHHLDLVNLNMCSAWTHICADTLRSTAVLVAAAFSYLLPMDLSASNSDAIAAVAVSIIILGSLLPLMQGLILTALQIYHLHKVNPQSTATSNGGLSTTMIEV